MTKNFTLSELLSSRTAHERGFSEQFDPPQEIIDNLRNLAVNILQPIRDAYGMPIHVNSGYRCERLNQAVNGQKRSEHLKGMAADITCSNARKLYDIASLLDLPFRQLIYYKDRNFVHVSYNPNDIKKQAWQV